MKTKKEKYFWEYIDKITNIDAQYLNLPTEISFNTSLNECIEYCIKKRKIPKARKTFFFNDFYDYLLTDDIFPEIDESEYLNLLNKLSKAMNDSNYLEGLEFYLIKIRSLFSNKYFNKLIEKLKAEISTPGDNYSKLEKYTMVFINEVLLKGISYPFLSRFFKYNRKYGFDFVIDYISNEQNENIEMFLPLKHYNSRTLRFLEEQGQQIQEVKINGKSVPCCKVFCQGIDYFNICKDNMLRIDSYFNLFKFYRDSKISFNYEKEVLIKRTKLKDNFSIKLFDLISYTYFVGKKEIVNKVISNISILKDENNPLFFSINNILSYAEKNNNLINPGSFVDNWIALENIVRLSGLKKGFEGVLEYIPKALDVPYYRKELNSMLKQIKKSATNEIITIDKFLNMTFNDNVKFLNNYKYSTRRFIENEISTIKSFNEINIKLRKIRNYLRRDLYRIYELRNKYVHSSDLNSHIGVMPYKLKKIFSDFFDLFMKTLNANIKYGNLKVRGKDIINDITRKFENREVSLKALSNKLKINGIKITNKKLNNQLKDNEIVANIIFDRILILNHFK